MFIILLFLYLIIGNIVYANDIKDILRNLESPDVNYHIDNEIRILKEPINKTLKSNDSYRHLYYVQNNEVRTEKTKLKNIENKEINNRVESKVFKKVLEKDKINNKKVVENKKTLIKKKSENKINSQGKKQFNTLSKKK